MTTVNNTLNISGLHIVCKDVQIVLFLKDFVKFKDRYEEEKTRMNMKHYFICIVFQMTIH